MSEGTAPIDTKRAIVAATAIYLLWVLGSLVRAFPFLLHSLPTGTDYGHHVFLAELYLRDGRLPTTFPYYQLGGIPWAPTPGSAVVYAALAALAAAPAIEALRATALFGAISVVGTYAMALRLLGRRDAALVAAFLTAVWPTDVAMVAWSGYANLLALALYPFALLAWLDYWEHPGSRSLARAVIVIGGVAAIHHVTTLWLALTLATFSSLAVATRSTVTARAGRILGFLALSLVVCLPVVSRAAVLWHGFGAGEALSDPARFASTRITWPLWVHMTSPLGLPLLAGAAGLAFGGRSLASLMLVSHLAVSLMFAFGWIAGIGFYYTRAVYYLALPMALGGGALVAKAGSTTLRAVVAAMLTITLGLGAVVRAEREASFYAALDASVLEAAEWLTRFSGPTDVVVTSAALGFHLPRLVSRPIMVALSPEFMATPAELPVGKDAMAVLEASPRLESVLAARSVRFVFLSTRHDASAVQRLTSHPAFTTLYRNTSACVLGVRPR